jgi:hypothetical protein
MSNPSSPVSDAGPLITKFLEADRTSFDGGNLKDYFDAPAFHLIFKHASASDEIGAVAHRIRNAVACISADLERATNGVTASIALADRQLFLTLLDGLKMVATTTTIRGPERLAAWDALEDARGSL